MPMNFSARENFLSSGIKVGPEYTQNVRRSDVDIRRFLISLNSRYPDGYAITGLGGKGPHPSWTNNCTEAMLKYRMLVQREAGRKGFMHPDQR
jgi:hypothetical protein